MKLPGWRLILIAGLCLTGGSGVASLSSMSLEGHQSSLRAAVTTMDGGVRNVTLEGVGCPTSMCSRVKARESRTASVWLDGLASISGISRGPGSVTATLQFKDGTRRQASILSTNRVLYVQTRLGRTEKLDLGSLSRIDFQ